LVDSRRTRNEYELSFCIASEVFSVMCGASSVLISLSALGDLLRARLDVDDLRLLVLCDFGAPSGLDGQAWGRLFSDLARSLQTAPR
jgi:hypothetical protein